MPRPKTIKSTISGTSAIGRRKRSTASVTLLPGKGEVLINKKVIEIYFPDARQRKAFSRPFEITETVGQFTTHAQVRGGGKTGQYQAVLLAIARALVKIKPETKKILRAQGFLTRDPREKERRKVGTGGKARRQKQSPKR